MTACGSMQLADVTGLSDGMTKSQVDNIMGRPVRLLSTSFYQDGRTEVYEYVSYRNESYAIEFWNGRLSRYDFLYENAATVAPGPVVRPSNPPRPTAPSRPGTNGRPGSSRPGTNSPGGRTSVEGRGSKQEDKNTTSGSGSSRPSTDRSGSNSNTSRPNVSNSSTQNSRENATTKPRTTNKEESE